MGAAAPINVFVAEPHRDIIDQLRYLEALEMPKSAMLRDERLALFILTTLRHQIISIAHFLQLSAPSYEQPAPFFNPLNPQFLGGEKWFHRISNGGNVLKKPSFRLEL